MTTIIDLTSGNSTSSWIVKTDPYPGQDNVDRGGRMTVQFSRSIDAKALRSENFTIYNHNGTPVSNAFQPIDVKRDYHSVNKKLTLKLAKVLEPNTEYLFVIQNLFDATGSTQDVQHVVEFITSSSEATIEPIAHAVDLKAEDNRLAARPIDIILDELEVVQPENIPAIVRSVPTSGAYGISSTYNNSAITLYFDKPVQAIEVALSRQAVSAHQSVLEDVAFDLVVSRQNVTINVLDGFSEAYSYIVDIIKIDDEFTSKTIKFTTVLPNLMVNVQDILAFGRQDPQEVARQIYLAGLYIQEIANLAPGSYNIYASDYVKYSTLYHFSLMGASMSDGLSITLGDLNISRKSSESNWSAGDPSARWRALMEEALQKLLGKGTAQVGLKGRNDTMAVNDRDYRSVRGQYGDRRLMY